MHPLFAESAEHAPVWMMVLFAVVMLVTYVGVAYERLHKTVAALCGAAVLTVMALALGVFKSYGVIHEHLARELNIFGVIIGTGIPVAATLIPIVQYIGEPSEPLWWSLVLGCNLGGNATPIGSISCVIAIHTLHKETDIRVGWGEFLKIGGSTMVVQLAGAIVYLLVLYWLGLFPQL